MTTKKNDLNNQFKQVWARFNSNLSALWIFSQEIANLAEQWDEQMIHKLAVDIADLFGDDPEEVEKDIRELTPSVSELEVQPDYRENASVREIIDAFQSGEFQRRALRWIGRNPKQGYRLLDVMSEAYNQPPANGILLRRSALVSLVGFLELLVQDLYTVYYSALNSEGSSIRGEKLPRGLWKEIEFFKTLGIDTGLFGSTMDELHEIIQRRNLVVHQDGIIDAKYLDNAPIGIIQGKGFAVGQRLLITKSYLLNSLELVHYFGAGLHQLCWRIWGNDVTQVADSSYEAFMLFSLQHERYPMVIKLAEFGQHLKMEKVAGQVNDVNHAIALREMGRESEVQQWIAKLKRSRPNWKIKTAITFLERDNDQAYLLLKQAAQQNKLKSINPNWPLFKLVRGQAWFDNAFKIDQSTPGKKRR